VIALLIFSVIAAGIVWIAGRKDAALDPRLTTVALGLLAAFPFLLFAVPKVEILPVVPGLPDVAGNGGLWFIGVLAVWGIGTQVELLRIRLTMGKLAAWREQSVLVETVEGVEIRRLEELRGPVAAGVFRKVVFVPGDWEQWDTERRRIVLDHELAHHRRRDPLRRCVAAMAVAVNWWNPLVRWIVKRLLIQCEFACDAEVLKRGVPAKEYASLLCDMAEETPARGLTLAMAEKSGLETRVRRMMGPRHDEQTMATSWLILFAVAAAALLAVIGERQIAGYTKGEVEKRRMAEPFPGR